MREKERTGFKLVLCRGFFIWHKPAVKYLRRFQSKTWNLEQSWLIYCHHYLQKQNSSISPQAALKLALSAVCYVFGGFLRISLSTMGKADGPGEIMDLKNTVLTWPMSRHETFHLNVYLSKRSLIFSLQNSNLGVSSLWLILRHEVTLPLPMFLSPVEMLLPQQDLQIFSY